MFSVRPRSIRTIFFDAGFTLLRPFPSLPQMCHQVCTEHGLTVTVEQIRQAVKQTAGFYHQYTERYCPWIEEERIQTMWVRYYKHLFTFFLPQHDPVTLDQLAQVLYQLRELPTSWQVYEDVIPVLAALRTQGYSLGVISNWGFSLREILRQHRLTPYVDDLIVSAHVHQAKPAPTIFEMALLRTATRAEETIYVGDDYLHDVLGARAAGIFPILLNRQQTLRAEHIDCPVISSLRGLPELMRSKPVGNTKWS